jgi:hypothetical protein
MSKVVDPSHDNLTPSETALAAKDLIKYPQVVRGHEDEPIPNQEVGLFSFNLFREPKKMQSGHLAYGFVKFRGNYSSNETATAKATSIIKTQDSTNEVLIFPVGQWYPITTDPNIVTDRLDVKMNDNDKQLRDQAAKEKQEDDKKIMRQIKEREEECKSHDHYDDTRSLDFYTMKRNTEKFLTEAIEAARTKLEESELKRRTVWNILRQIEVDYPEYPDTWLDRYNQERAKAGIPEYIPSDKQFQDYNNYHPTDLPPADYESLSMK